MTHLHQNRSAALGRAVPSSAPGPEINPEKLLTDACLHECERIDRVRTANDKSMQGTAKQLEADKEQFAAASSGIGGILFRFSKAREGLVTKINAAEQTLSDQIKLGKTLNEKYGLLEKRMDALAVAHVEHDKLIQEKKPKEANKVLLDAYLSLAEAYRQNAGLDMTSHLKNYRGDFTPAQPKASIADLKLPGSREKAVA